MGKSSFCGLDLCHATQAMRALPVITAICAAVATHHPFADQEAGGHLMASLSGGQSILLASSFLSRRSGSVLLESDSDGHVGDGETRGQPRILVLTKISVVHAQEDLEMIFYATRFNVTSSWLCNGGLRHVQDKCGLQMGAFTRNVTHYSQFGVSASEEGAIVRGMLRCARMHSRFPTFFAFVRHRGGLASHGRVSVGMDERAKGEQAA